MDLEEIKRGLRGLDTVELQEVVRLAAWLMASKPPADGSRSQQLAYQALLGPLQRKVAAPGRLSYLKGESLVEATTALEFLMGWLKGAFQVPLRETDYPPWFNLFGELLVEFLESRNVPLSARALLRQASSVPALVAQAFPGYIEAGLLGWVMEPLRRGRREEEERENV